MGDAGIRGADVDVDPAAAGARADARDRGVVGMHAHVLVGGEEGLVDLVQAGVGARGQDQQGGDPGARRGVEPVGAAVEFDFDAVLAVFQPARGKFEEDRQPVAAHGARKAWRSPFSSCRRELASRVTCAALSGGMPRRSSFRTWRPPAARGSKPLMCRCGCGRSEALVHPARRSARWRAVQAPRRSRSRRRLDMAVGAGALSGHHPDGAMWMIGMAATVHGKGLVDR